MDMTLGCTSCQQRKEWIQSHMSVDFKKGFLVALGVMAAVVLVGWVMRIF